MTALALVAMLLTLVGEGVLRAGKDVLVPERIAQVPVVYPPEARGTQVMGIILLELTLNEEGRPVEIQVVRGTPLLDRAAIEAAKQWRYKSTLVDGLPKGVSLREVLDVFPSEGAIPPYFVSMLGNKKEAQAYRLLAIQRLRTLPTHDQSVVKALTKATEDADERIRGAAAEALVELFGAGK